MLQDSTTIEGILWLRRSKKTPMISDIAICHSWKLLSIYTPMLGISS